NRGWAARFVNGGAMTMQRRMWLGGFFFALMLTQVGVNAYSALAQFNGSYDGWTAGQAQITSVDQNGPGNALRVGDEFVSINGLTLQDDPDIRNYNRRVRPGTIYTMAVRRQGKLIEITLATAGFPIKRWLMPIADILVQLAFLLTGLIIFL